MELRHLRHFAAVVEAGNLSKAADKVFISQPALTRSIKTLEDLVGAPLLERRPRGVVPTPAGTALHRYAKLIINEAAKARAEVAAVQAGARGQLSIGVAAMFADHLVDRAIANLCAVSEVAMHVRQGFIEELVEALRDGRIDILFSNLGNSALPDDVVIEPMIDANAYIYAGAGHPLAGSGRVTKQQLATQRWAIIDHPNSRNFIELYFSVDGLPAPPSMLQTNALPLVVALLASDGFVAIIPEHVAAPQVARGAIVRLDAPETPVRRKAGLVRRADSVVHPLADQFAKALRQVCIDASSAS